MRVVEVIFVTLSWILCILGISLICSYYDNDWLDIVLIIIVGCMYGKYLNDMFKDKK